MNRKRRKRKLGQVKKSGDKVFYQFYLLIKRWFTIFVDFSKRKLNQFLEFCNENSMTKEILSQEAQEWLGRHLVSTTNLIEFSKNRLNQLADLLKKDTKIMSKKIKQLGTSYRVKFLSFLQNKELTNDFTKMWKKTSVLVETNMVKTSMKIMKIGKEKLQPIANEVSKKFNQIKDKISIKLERQKIELPKKHSKTIKEYFNKEYFKKLLKEAKTKLEKFPESVKDFCKPNTYWWEKCQILVYYLLGLIDLYYYGFSQILASNKDLERIISTYFPHSYEKLNSSLMQFLTSPEKVFILSYVGIEFLLIKDLFNFTVFSKYHFLLVFVLIMCQNVIMGFIDGLSDHTIRDALSTVYHFKPDFEGNNWVIFSIILTFLIFTWLYIVFFSQGWRQKQARVHGFEWITDSIALWFQQQRKRKEEKEREEKKREEKD